MKSGKLIKSITFANGLTLQSTIGQPFFVSIHYGFFTVHDQGFIFDKSKCKSINLQTNCFPMQITINCEPLFEFASHAEWVNKAQGWFGNLNLPKHEKTVCLDPDGNVLTIGADFKIADYRNLFPVKVFRLVRTSESFPKFWYESNACWGNVESLGDLSEKAALQLAEPNGIDTIDTFLDKSVKVEGEGWNFGTRREHTSDYSLRHFLALNNLLGEFITYFSSYRR